MVQPQTQVHARNADGAYQPTVSHTRLGRVMRGALASWLLASAACGVSDEGRLPPDVEDPATLRTPNGALALYRQTLIDNFPYAFDRALVVAGVMTDELAALPITLTTAGPFTALDSRQGLAFSPSSLHRLRAHAREAREYLLAYAADSSSALPGHMYAAEGYAEILLADLFCSGIPLSTVNFDGDYTLAAGSTTEDVYGHALALLDTALTLSGDSARIQHLIAVGRGRALLALNSFAAAAAAVAVVPDGYRYDLSVSWVPTGGFAPSSTAPHDSLKLIWYWTRNTNAGSNGLRLGAPNMGNQEGGNGLDYRTSGDPRTQFVAKGTDGTNTFFIPRKYTSNGTSVSSPIAFMLASGIEARLIEAEAVLHAGSGEWLTKLNALRTDGTFTTQPTANPTDDPANVDTLWNAGSGGVARLRPLEDPGSEAARIDLVFRERAFWLYLTGHRQGDLRRLVRQYNRARTAVYPTGAYPGGTGEYGSEVVIPMPPEELQLNPVYTGCFHTNA